MPHQTFVSACLSGAAIPEDIDDWIGQWHTGPSDLSLDEYLGLTPAEGALFAERPESLRFIIATYQSATPNA